MASTNGSSLSSWGVEMQKLKGEFKEMAGEWDKKMGRWEEGVRELKEKAGGLQKQVGGLQKQVGGLQKEQHFLVVCAAEILKWVMKMKVACEAFDGNEPTEISVRVFVQTLQELEELVEHCKRSIDKCPSLASTHPQQVQIITRYENFKALLPDSFK